MEIKVGNKYSVKTTYFRLPGYDLKKDDIVVIKRIGDNTVEIDNVYFANTIRISLDGFLTHFERWDE